MKITNTKINLFQICTSIWYNSFCIQVALSMRVFAVIFKKALLKRRISINVVSPVVCQRAINIINCAQKGASLITEQGAVKEQIHICFSIKATWTKWIQSILKTMFKFMLTQVT